MNRGVGKKHHIDIMFLMIVFLIFTFSAVSVLIMAINSYRNVVTASESNGSARIASAYIREIVHQNDIGGNVYISKLDGVDCLKVEESEDYSIYIYEYGGYLRELNCKEDSGATVDFGDKIMEITALSFEELEGGDAVEICVTDTYGNDEIIDIAVIAKAEQNVRDEEYFSDVDISELGLDLEEEQDED